MGREDVVQAITDISEAKHAGTIPRECRESNSLVPQELQGERADRMNGPIFLCHHTVMF